MEDIYTSTAEPAQAAANEPKPAFDLSLVRPLNAEWKAKPYPFNADQLKWLETLESTHLPQAKGYLNTMRADGTSGLCCLGIACLALGLEGKIKSNGNGYRLVVEFDDEITIAPVSVQERLRLRGATGDFAQKVRIKGTLFPGLASMNDGGDDGGKLTFKQIAAYIRHDPWNVFRAPEHEAVSEVTFTSVDEFAAMTATQAKKAMYENAINSLAMGQLNAFPPKYMMPYAYGLAQPEGMVFPLGGIHAV